MNKLIVIIFLSLCSFAAFGQENYPKPTDNEDILFYIQHNRGKNTIIYALNKNEDQGLDIKNPIRVYRQLFDEGGIIRPLNTIQKNFAYGVDSEQQANGTYEVSIVSMPQQKFFLHLPKHGNPYVSTTVNGVNMQVHRIFIQQKEGTSGLGTKVDYLIFYGRKNNIAVQQKLFP